MTKWRRAVFGIVVAAAVLSLGEVGLRTFVSPASLLFSWERPGSAVAFTQTGLLVSPPHAHYQTTEGAKIIEYATNGQGLREPVDLPMKKGPGTRYLAVGDSWIWGTSLTQGETTVDRIEKDLRTALGAESVEIANAGMQGACAFDMYAAFRRYVPAMEFDGVIIGMPHNEGREGQTADTRKAYLESIAPAARSRWMTYLLLRRVVYWARSNTVAPGVPGSTPTDTIAQTSIAIQDILRIVSEARGMGLKVFFLDFPNSWEFQGGLRPQLVMPPEWQKALDAAHVPYVGHAMLQRECWGAVDTAHPGPAGANVLAMVATDLILNGKTAASRLKSPTCTP